MIPLKGEVFGGNDNDERRVLTMPTVLTLFRRRGNAEFELHRSGKAEISITNE